MEFTDKEKLAISKILTEVMNPKDKWKIKEVSFLTQLFYMIEFGINFLEGSKELKLYIAMAILEQSSYEKRILYGKIFSEMNSISGKINDMRASELKYLLNMHGINFDRIDELSDS